MQEPETPYVDSAEPELPRRRSPWSGGLSAESLLASFLLHLALLLIVIILAPERGTQRHEGMVVDISEFTIPESQPAPHDATPPAAAAPRERTPAKSAVVEIPAETAEKTAQEKVAREEQPPPEAQAAPTPEAAAGPADVQPAVPEPQLPHAHGEYDAFEVYKASVAEQVRQATDSSRALPARALFSGRLAVHLYLDPSGNHRSSPLICLGHSEVYKSPDLPEPLAQAHFRILVKEVVAAVVAAAPYAQAPAGVEIPEEMTYFIYLTPN